MFNWFRNRRKQRPKRALNASYGRLPEPSQFTSSDVQRHSSDDSGFIAGLVVGGLLSGSSGSDSTPTFSGGGGESGGAGASGSWDSGDSSGSGLNGC